MFLFQNSAMTTSFPEILAKRIMIFLCLPGNIFQFWLHRTKDTRVKCSAIFISTVIVSSIGGTWLSESSPGSLSLSSYLEFMFLSISFSSGWTLECRSRHLHENVTFLHVSTFYSEFYGSIMTSLSESTPSCCQLVFIDDEVLVPKCL